MTLLSNFLFIPIISDLFFGIIRSILWIIVSLLLKCLDFFFEMLIMIASVDIFKDDLAIYLYYTALGITLGPVIIFKIFKIFFLKTIDEEVLNDQKKSDFNLLKRIVLISIIMVTIPFILRITSSLVSAIFDLMLTDGLKPSSLFCPANTGVNDSSNAYTGLDQFKKEIIHCPDPFNSLDINEKINGKYRYFPNWSSFIGVTIASVFGVKIFFALGLSIINRFVTMIYSLILAAKAFADFVEGDYRAIKFIFNTCFYGLITNVLQIIFLVISFKIPDIFQGFLQERGGFGLAELQGFIINCMVIIASLYAVLQAPSSLSSILGTDATAAQSMNDVNNFMRFGKQGMTLAAAGGAAIGAAVASRQMAKNPLSRAGLNSIGLGATGVFQEALSKMISDKDPGAREKTRADLLNKMGKSKAETSSVNKTRLKELNQKAHDPTRSFTERQSAKKQYRKLEKEQAKLDQNFNRVMNDIKGLDLNDDNKLKEVFKKSIPSTLTERTMDKVKDKAVSLSNKTLDKVDSISAKAANKVAAPVKKTFNTVNKFNPMKNVFGSKKNK